MFEIIGILFKVTFAVIPPLLIIAGIAGFVAGRHFGNGKRGKIASAAAILLAFSIAGAGFYATNIEPKRFVIRHVTLKTEKARGPLRILHFSDVQASKVGETERRVFGKIRGIDADILFYTGDFLQPVPPVTFDSQWPEIMALFATLKPQYGIYAVPGNMEHMKYIEKRDCSPQLKILTDRGVFLETPGVNLYIYGMNNSSTNDPQRIAKSLDKLKKNVREDYFTIVLGHHPDFAFQLKDYPVDLALAGHTHGGQVRLPFIGPLITLSKVPRKWSRGFNRIGNTWLNVSAGLGCEHSANLPPIRFNCPPEVTIIELRPTK